MNCPACGAESPLEHKFCSECGASLPIVDVQNPENESPEITKPSQDLDSPRSATPESAEETCEWCGSTLEADARFCIECGRRVMKVEDVRAAHPAPVVKPTQPDTEKPMSDGDVGFLAGLFGASTGCGCGCLPIAGVLGFLLLLAALL